MQRLRTTFKRSRTPTGADMKTQSSLEVPKTVRSASFDEIQLQAKAHSSGSLLSPVGHGVPLGSRSFDSPDPPPLLPPPQPPPSPAPFPQEDAAISFLDVPAVGRFQRRRSSSERPSPVCVHCLCVDEYERLRLEMDADVELLSAPPTSTSVAPPSPVIGTSSSSSDDDADREDDDAPSSSPKSCGIKVTLDQPPPSSPSRRRSIHRQEAFFFVEPPLEVSDNDPPSDATSHSPSSWEASPPPISAPPLFVRDLYLAVPDLKRDRAASVDSCFIGSGGSASDGSGRSGCGSGDGSGGFLEVPQAPTTRSRSVDIVLPTEEQARYKALAVPGVTRRSIAANTAGDRDVIVERPLLRSIPDWSEAAVNGDHLWQRTNASGDLCYVGEAECAKHGPRVKCASCKIIAHQTCVSDVKQQAKLTCKPTFRDGGPRVYREKTATAHHWVHRRSQKGKCMQCGKSFQSKLSFTSKEIVALSCSWCKTAYHNKEACFNVARIGEECSLGIHSGIIVPPSWIVKLPRRGNFKSSLRKSPKKKTSTKKRNKEKAEKDSRTFVIKPIPTANVHPVIVFINPKSGGNQGVKLLQKFQWHLNPRQVFDLTQGGPKMGLEMFRKVPNLRVLACGGDGTVGWVLSVLDELQLEPSPAVGVLPLGTGNDLARALGWGGGYTDEPVSKILSNIGESDIVQLDRWRLTVEPNGDAEANKSESGKDKLPLNVVNNYFSLGVDAQIALEFHEAREAHPEKFNSRLRNKVFYGQMGGKDLLKRKWKGLAELVTLECDGKDLTPKLKDHKVHAVVFLNIPSYGGGTHPWNRAMGIEQATDDGMIEVVGLTTYQLPLLQAGGHGTCITQCRNARIVTTKTIPMQVDGEACRLNPSIINISLLNQAMMLAKRRGGKPNAAVTSQDKLKVPVQRISMLDYEQHHYDKDLLKQAAVPVAEVEVAPAADLEQVRAAIGKAATSLSPEWCFVDSCTAERFFRVDRAQEHLHYLMDIAADTLYILESAEDQSPSSLPGGESGERSTPELSDEALSDANQQTSVSISVPPPDSNANTDSSTPMTTPVVLSKPFPKTDSQHSVSSISDDPRDSIFHAAFRGDLARLQALHARGVALLESGGRSPLYGAAANGHRDVVKFLLGFALPQQLATPDIEEGRTALHAAAAGRHRAICYLLVAGGAPLFAEDNNGLKPRDLALRAGDQELADYFQSQERFHIDTDNRETVV